MVVFERIETKGGEFFRMDGTARASSLGCRKLTQYSVGASSVCEVIGVRVYAVTLNNRPFCFVQTLEKGNTTGEMHLFCKSHEV